MTRPFYFLVLIITCLACPQWPGIAYSGESLPPGREVLIDKYQMLEEKLAKSPFGFPAYLDSYEGKNASGVDVYGIIDYSFDAVQRELTTPAHWCDITLLHNHVRACIDRPMNGASLLTLYNVKKANQPVKDAYQITYKYWVIAQQPVYLDLLIVADEGPYNTRDHRFRFEAVPLGKTRTFVHLSYSYKYGVLGYVAMKSYFAIFSRGDVGFSITGADSKKKPVYVSGLKGAIERNVMRYYLAILAYMDTHKYPVDQRFEKRINRWYDLTVQYKRQLYAMERKEYLANKRQDLKNQAMMRDALKRTPK